MTINKRTKIQYITIIAIVVVALFAALFLSGCSNSANGIEAKAAETTSLNGTWKAEGFEAIVHDNSVEVNLVNGDSSGLYWKGTFPVGGEVVKSIADRHALDESIVGSSDAEKVFTVKDDEISFKITIMGTSRVVHLKKG